jgi:hypothetical protein
MNLDAKPHAAAGNTLTLRSALALDARPHNRYLVECFDPAGNLRWREEVDNLIPDAGANDLLTQYLTGAAYSATWNVALVDNAGFTGFANGDTAITHPGWVEATSYSNPTRVPLALGPASSRSMTNAANPAVFSINGTVTLNGAFITSSPTKAGTAGVLYGEASFTTPRDVLSGDTLNVTVTLSA